ncbi:CBS domain-containing protein [Schleiferia thermophila]|uniref:CBS domain-containing protein n=1 Tax=Schleiferia thermophila TaxID=884107 RepID=A0A369A1P7_9FLAO|nr:CBS domain-containing protein [Schleiferia thermophila]
MDVDNDYKFVLIMTGENYISLSLAPLHAGDTISFAIDEMIHQGTRSLPLLSDGQLIGILRLEDLENLSEDYLSLGDLPPHLIKPGFIYVDSHELDIIASFGIYKCDVLPVLDREKQYQGAVLAYDVLTTFGQSLSFKMPGGILVLEIPSSDYQLSQIAQIAESGEARILSLYLNEIPDSQRILITLKLNRENLDGIIQTFERYNYEVKAIFGESQSIIDLKHRYELLMKWINI